MKYTAVFVAIAGFVAAQDINPASATASLLAALPTSLQQLALTNLGAASSAISAEIANPTGPPAWFTGLPPAVQTYFITANGGSVRASATNGVSSALSSVSSAVSSLNSALSSATRAASSGASSRAASASSSGMAALPTAVIGSGLAGAVGIAAMLAL